MNAKKQLPTMYETNPTIAGLNKVPGFDPRVCLRRTKSQNGGQEVLKLDLRYKKLWFRLAHPTGRLKTTALRITEQLAIIEAKVFLDKGDTEPVANFTVQRTVHDTPGGLYIQAAQYEAQDTALNDAGFGLQFSDVSVAPGEEIYGSELPLASTATSSVPAAVAAPPTPPAPVKEARPVAKEEPATMPATAVETTVEPTAETASELPISQSETMAADSEPTAESNLPVEKSLPVGNRNQTSTPIRFSDHAGNKETPAETQVQSTTATLEPSGASPVSVTPIESLPVQAAPAESKQAAPFVSTASTEAPLYTRSTPVAELLTLMTYEEACSVQVDVGTCRGQTMRNVAERRPASLKWYIQGYGGDNNILRAAAQIMLDSLSAQKAG